MKRHYLPKDYIFTDRDGFKIEYSKIIDRIIKGFYEEFLLTPSRSAIRLISVAEGFIKEEYHVQVLFVLLDTKKCGIMPKRYILDFWSCNIKKID